MGSLSIEAVDGSFNALPNRAKLQNEGFILVCQLRHYNSAVILREIQEKKKIRIVCDLCHGFSSGFSFHIFNIFEFDKLFLNSEKMKGQELARCKTA